MDRFDAENSQFKIISGIRNAKTEIFSELIRIAELDPSTDLMFCDLDGVDFSGSDLRGFNLTGCSVDGANWENCLVDQTTILPDLPAEAVRTLIVSSQRLEGDVQPTATLSCVVLNTFERASFLPAAKSIHPLELACVDTTILNIISKEIQKIRPNRTHILVDKSSPTFAEVLRPNQALEGELRGTGKSALLSEIESIDKRLSNTHVYEKRNTKGGALVNALRHFVEYMNESHVFLIDPTFLHLSPEYSAGRDFENWRETTNDTILKCTKNERALVSRALVPRRLAIRILGVLDEDDKQNRHLDSLSDLFNYLTSDSIKITKEHGTIRYLRASDTVKINVAYALNNPELIDDFKEYMVYLTTDHQSYENSA